jgi:antitoxin FitA
MPRIIQIRNVPDLHRMLKARAAKAGMSLSDYLSWPNPAERPALDELRKRLQRRERVRLPTSAAAIIRVRRGAI